MRVWFIAACCLLQPASAFPQDVRVQLYTARPPESLELRATQGDLRWRTCPDCAETTAHELTVAATDETAGADVYVTGHYELVPATGPPFASSHPARIARHEGHLSITVTLPLEEYVAAVLTAESGDFQNAESRKAMAVVARAYATRFRGQHSKEGFDFCDTTHCQAFGWKTPPAAIQAAVNATRGEVLRYDGKVAATFYHQNCGGTTASAAEAWPGVSEAYLTSHADPYCAARGALTWESAIRVADLSRALRANGLASPQGWNAIEIVSRSKSGRVDLLRLTGGSGGAARISASTFRFAVDRALGWEKIRSNFFEVRNLGEDIVFSGRGSGHGVGLCQVGAEEMAREGKSYSEILGFYYPGTQLASPSPATAWQKRSAEHVELLSTQPDADAALLPTAEKILREDEQATGWSAARVRLQIYPTLDAYRDTTGQPGWVAASTRGSTIRLQPLKELEKRGIVESTLRHEIFHVLVEEKARAGIPLWFREGIVLFLADQNPHPPQSPALSDDEMEAVLRRPVDRAQVQKAYIAAEGRVASLVQQHGKEIVLGWLRLGIPADVRSAVGSGVAPH